MQISLTEIMDQNDREAALGVAKQARKARTPVLRYPPRPEGVTKLNDMTPATESEVAARLALFQKVVTEGQYQRVRWYDHNGKQASMMLDLFTAQHVVNMHNAMTPEQRARIFVLEPVGIVNMCWKLSK